jgi:hypothetical protein
VMKARRVSFYVNPEVVASAMGAIENEVLPRFLALPHFRGYVVLESDHDLRREFIVLSFWDDGLEGSKDASDAFVKAVHDVTGTNPMRETYNILAAMVTDESGAAQITVD